MSRFLSPLKAVVLVIALLAITPAFASTIHFTGPEDANGNPCIAGAPHCIIGDPALYEVFSVDLTQPTPTNPNWVASIQTNYGTTIPTPGSVIPPFPWVDGALYSISDLLFTWNNNDYGVVLAPHTKAGMIVDTDSMGNPYKAGSLYQVSGFQASGAVIPPQTAPRQNTPVWINPGGILLGNGNVSVAQTGNGITSAMYTITVQFSAPPNFLSTGTFTLEMSSYVCANGLLIGTGSFFNGGTGGGVPEPGTFLLGLPMVLFGGYRLVRKKRAEAQV